MSNDNISCRIKRSDRPCLVCSGHMDLIEAHPSRFNLFSGALPYMCGAEGVDCLDCPKCGFKTTTADYQYLHMCKKERQTGTGSIIPESPSYKKKTRGGGDSAGGDRTSSSTTRSSSSSRRQQQQQIGNGRRSSSISNSNSNSIRGENTSTTCSHCQASLESSSWQFCPSCGKKCVSSSSTSGTITMKNEQNNIQGNEKNDTMSASNSCSSSSRSNSNSNSNSRDSGGIVRMVTPPKRTSTDDYSSPVQMQY